MSRRRKHIGYHSQITLCRTVDRKSNPKSRGKYHFFSVALAGSQYTICNYYFGLQMKWHFYEKAREMGLEFGTFKWTEKKKENQNKHTRAPVNRGYVASIWSLTLVSTASIALYFVFHLNVSNSSHISLALS